MPDASPIAAALAWIQDVLLGSLANTLAVMAVAICGLGMLLGQVNWRSGLRVVMGCSLVFGAARIASGLLAAAEAGAGVPAAEFAAIPPLGVAMAHPVAAVTLAQAYAAATSAVLARFPGAHGVARITATVAQGGAIARLDVAGAALDPAVAVLAGQVIGASGVRLASPPGQIELPQLEIGPAPATGPHAPLAEP
jgi:type IV secretory pathway VirB2 component (pilin)